jgi:uncharacterized protein (DUF58 family)
VTAAWSREVLDPAFLRGLDRVVLARRHAARDENGGFRVSTSRPSGLEWIGHRPYQSGDDLRYLDWHLYARIGTPFVRQFHAERGRRLDLLIDRSRSMTLGRPSKAARASALAFVLGYVALCSGETVGALAFADRVLSSLPAGRGPAQRARLLDFLLRTPAGVATRLAAAIEDFASRATEIGQVVVLSDLLDDGVESGLLALRSRGFDVVVLRLRAECDEAPELPGGAATMVDVETGRRVQVVLGAAERARYREARRRESEAAASFCNGARIGFADVGTWRPLAETVFQDLRRAGVLDGRAGP